MTSLTENIEQSITLNIHQRQIIQAPFSDRFYGVEHFFLVGGFGSGKTTADKFSIFDFIKRYQGHRVMAGIGGVTQTLLRKTLIADIIKTCKATNSKYHLDKQNNILTIGTIEFVLIALDQPDDIFAYNLSAFWGDELDELEQSKAIEGFRSVNERVRVQLPPITDSEKLHYPILQARIEELRALGMPMEEWAEDPEVKRLTPLSGRMPFSIWSTTAHGYRGTYQVIEELKRAGQKYVLIRGETKANPKATNFQRLWDLYTPNERLAYLEGRFVNLTSGRVYYGYDEAVNMTKDPIGVHPHEEVYVGQDMNEGYSKGAGAVVRDGKIYVDHTFSFKSIGAAPAVMRNQWPFNRIMWIPDNSGKPILGGYDEEIESHNIEVVWTGLNPNIRSRIFIVNKLFQMGRLILGPDCQDLSMALKTRQFDKKGTPEKGTGEKAPDHLCDCFEYMVFWLASNIEDFMDIYELTPAARKDDSA